MSEESSTRNTNMYRIVNRALISAASETRYKQQKQNKHQEILFPFSSSPENENNRLTDVQKMFRDSVFNDACLTFGEIKRYASIFLGIPSSAFGTGSRVQTCHKRKNVLLGCVTHFAEVFNLGPEWRYVVVIWMCDTGLLPRAVCRIIADFLIIRP